MYFNKELKRYVTTKDCLQCPKYDKTLKKCLDNGETCFYDKSHEKDINTRITALETQIKGIVGQVSELIKSHNQLVKELESIKQELNA